VCLDRQTGALTHRPLDYIPAHEAIAKVSQAATLDGAIILTLDTSVLHPHVNRTAATEPAIRWPITAAERLDAVHIKAPRGLLSAQPDGSISETKTEGDQETFLILSDSELATLQLLNEERWVRRSSGEPVSPTDVLFEQGFLLRVGGDALQLPRDMPVVLHESPGSPAALTVFFDGWRIEELVAYRPLVFVVAFGPPHTFELLTLCIRSLLVGGKYDGDILVIGDRTRDQIVELLPEVSSERLHAYQLRAGNFIEYCAARYCLPDWADATRYQPLVYVDVDVMFDRPLEPFLHRLVVQPKISAQAESFARLASHAASGARLIKEDKLDVGDAPGFNSGILGIPSLNPHEKTLRQIYELVFRYAEVAGRDALSHFDQAIANYVTSKLAPIDYEFLTPLVRYTQRHQLQGGAEPLGFVHFWGSGRDPKAVMTDYFSSLIAASEE
jgi:hypothetical protein